MFRPVQLLSSVLSSARTGVLSAQSTFTLTRCRFISKGPNNQPWARSRHRDEISNEEDELEDVEDKFQRVVNKEVKRQKTVKYHILRRKMTPSGPPERKLTWEAIEEIRYLKQEQPEEWTVDRLAEGFSVSKDTILRVLRSKFVPSPERKAKQDTQVLVKLKQQALPSKAQVEQEKQRLPSAGTKAVLALGNRESAMVPAVHQNMIAQTEPNPPVALNVVTKQPFSYITKHSTDLSLKENQSMESSNEEEDGEEGWDGQVLSEDDIEELMTTIKSTPVVKDGNEFFDGNGNFLYRI
ncbi:neugrin [Periophthalmus magnuspinnatus]|uniref:neugrin n=1 Tax=Periophthalmus magnuspinnatus TaxID=409849 RepID=UPI00145B8241|nr:neugrin [Periophthalmus magnuspinnatus]